MKLFKDFLEEARSHTDQNKKMSAWQIEKKFYEHEKETGIRYFVSFTNLEKLGVNVQTRWIDPSGVYCYLLKESWEKYHIGIKEAPLNEYYPFAGDNKYINIFTIKPDAKILNISEYSKTDLFKDIEKLEEMENLTGLDHLIKNQEMNPFLRLWNITKELSKRIIKKRSPNYVPFQGPDSEKISDYQTMYKNMIPQRSVIVWNSLLRKLGYDMVIDDKGFGYIHENETLQGVVLNMKIINKVNRYENKFYKSGEHKEPENYLDVKYEMTNMDKKYIEKRSLHFEYLKDIITNNDDKLDLSIDFGIAVIDGILYPSHFKINSRRIRDVTFQDCKIEHSNIIGKYDFDQKFIHCVIEDTATNNFDITDSVISNCVLRNCNLMNVKVEKNCQLHGCALEGCNVVSATLFECEYDSHTKINEKQVEIRK